MSDDRVIRVKVPASALYNLDMFKEIQGKIMRELGCPACSSGLDIRYDIEREFVIDAELNIKANRISN